MSIYYTIEYHGNQGYWYVPSLGRWIIPERTKASLQGRDLITTAFIRSGRKAWKAFRLLRGKGGAFELTKCRVVKGGHRVLRSWEWVRPA